MDCALLYAGFSFTVGFVEEERDTASLTKMADTPECTHKMADAPERMHKMAATATGHIITAIHESGKITASHCEPNQVTADLPEPHNRPAKPESALVVPAKPGSALVVPAKPGSALVVPAKPGSVLVMPAKPGPARVMSATPESPAKMVTTPADAPLWPGLIACVLDAPLVSVRAAGIPRAPSLTAPEPLHVSADLPESLHVSADLPESLHISAGLLRPGGLRSRLAHRDLALHLLPQFHLRSTALLDCSMCGASGTCSLGGGSVTNPVHVLTPTNHIISCTTLQLHITHGLHFPSTIALITQLSPITHLH